MITTIFVVANFLSVFCAEIPFFLLPKEHEKLRGFSPLNACSDFYSFACDSWAKKTSVPNNQPVWNQWEIANHKIINRLEQILTDNKSETVHLHQARTVYHACFNSNDSKYVSELKILIKSLGGWPVVTSKWKESHAWEIVVAKIIRLLGIYPLLKIHVFVDLKNTSRHALYLEPGELNLPHTIMNSANSYPTIIDAYEQWIINTIDYLYPNNAKSKQAVKDIIKFEQELSKLLRYNNKFEQVSVNDLSKDIPALNWNAVFAKIFHNIPTPNNATKLIVLRNRQYLEKLVELISKTKKNVVANYVIWSVVKSLSRDTTNYMQELSFKMDQAVYGIKEDLPRNYECVKKVISYMDTHLIKKYANTYINPQSINRIDAMIKNIKTQFIKILKKNTWLDRKTKNVAVEKIAALKYVIAAPKWIENISFGDEVLTKLYYSTTHFINMIQLRAWKSKLHFEALHQKVAFKWTDTLFEVNAFYNVLQNTIFIPVGLLELPFFNSSAPLSFNYGALGSLIGHEISHALDTSGKHADKNGNIINWWSDSATNKYEEKISCYHQQYHKHKISDDFTIGENIADNVGLQLSFNALWSAESTKLQKHKILKKYAEQIFLLATRRYGVRCRTRA
ncbi:hypothetical protein FQR65_LT05928 [Abscondita terminalis]|nr:hypothetical protein FQR65_LT05928 [Abscondita terminalis]